MMKDENLTKLASGISLNSTLNTIKLWSLDCNRDMSVKTDQVDVELKVQCRSVPSEENIFAFSCRFIIAGHGGNKVGIINLDITYCLFYNVLNGYKPTEEEKDAFMKKCGVFHAWPYLRELVHNTTIKMGFVPLILPTITMDQLNLIPVEKSKK